MRFAAVVVFSLVAVSAHAQTPAFSPAAAGAAGAPRAIAAADFNRDGWIDYATAGTGRDSVAIHLNRGASGGFSTAHDIVVGGGPFEMAAGDLNRDAAPDLAIANADLDAVTILLGNGDGSFRPKIDIPVAGNPRGLTLADHDRDGRLDVFVTRYARHEWTVFYGDGEGGTRAEATFATGLNPQGIVTGDFNKDGYLDVVTADVGGTLSPYYSSGPQTWNRVPVAAGRAANVLAAADFNRDGWLDVAAAATSANTVTVYHGSASGLQRAADLGTGASPRGILLEDLNQDGALDIVASNRASNSVTIFPGRADAPGQFGAAVTQPAGSGSRVAAAGDFNHDGRADLVTANEFAGTATVLLNGTPLVKAGFSFRLEPLPGANTGGWGAEVFEPADFDRNGRTDFLVGSTIFFDGGARTLRLSESDLADAVVGDFDRNGHADVLMLSYHDRQIRLFANDGAGNFTGRAPQAIVNGSEIHAADLNRDGTLDVAIRRSDGAYQAVITVLHNRGDGTFALHADVRPPETGAFQFEIVDMNRDGYPDFVTGHVRPAGAGVLWGDAPGTFLQGDFEGTGEADGCCGHIAVADLNEDGVLDVAQPWSRKLFVFAGEASGGLAAPVEYQGGEYSYDVDAADIDRDGHIDLLVPGTDIFYGRGDGTFELRKFHARDFGYQAIFDLNADGLPDLVSNGVLVNERTETNRDPLPHAGLDLTQSYAAQFEEETSELDAWRSTDPNSHELTFEWRNEAGEVLSREQYFSPRFPRPGTYTFTLVAYDGYGGSATDTVTWTITPFKEVVLYTDSAWRHGAWQHVQDATAAGGIRSFHPDAGAAKVNTPLAEPANYIDLSFPADPTQTYKLWIRGKAQNDSWANDSVWVQLTGAVASDGNSYAIGSTSALPWNLEECSGCGIAGWGWEDDGWGAPDRHGVTLRFPEGGVQRIRIQTREDGVSIDQVVLSSERFLTVRPGSAKNDSVILFRTYW